jgi:nucleoside-diphosphate-sugar epimerase
MRLFVTGASGWIGSAVMRELTADGYEVVGLARSDAAAATVTALGGHAVRGDLSSLETLRAGASDADGVVHLAFMHDLAFSGNFAAAAEADRRAVEVFGDVLAGSDRPLVIASGTLGVAPGRLATEADGHGDTGVLGELGVGPATRAATAEATLALASRRVRASVVRLPPTNHGDGDNGFLAELVRVARRRGSSGYLADGANRWPAVHRLDSARLFHLAVERAPAGSTLHAVADEGVAIRDVAEIIGRHLHLPVVSVAPDAASEHFGWLAHFLGVDAPASSLVTRALMEWEPTEAGLLDDLDAGHYFRTGAA